MDHVFLAMVVTLASVRFPGPDTAPFDCPPSIGPAARAEAESAFATGVERSVVEDWPSAAEHFERAVRADPSPPLAHYALGQAYMGQKRFDDAVRAYLDGRAAFFCQSSLAPEERAQLARKRDDTIRELSERLRTLEAGSLVQGSVKWQAVNGGGSPNAAQVGQVAHALEEQLHQLQRWKYDPAGRRPPVELTLALGNAYFQTGSFEKAEREFRAALETEPKSGDAHHNLALVCLVTNRLDEAEAELRLAKKAGVPIKPRFEEELRKRKAAPRP